MAIYLFVFAAAVARICAAFEPAHQALLLGLSATAWSLAFGGFVVLYGPMLVGRRADQEATNPTA